MVKTLRDNFHQLFEIADSQGGYFTAKQATEAGFSTRMQTYHVQTGDWEREWRGVYRLHLYPNPRPDDLMVWYLWSADRSGTPSGVYSHDTALELYDLSTWSGRRLYMTVPKTFKRRSVPEALRLHRAELRHFEIAQERKVSVTTVVRTFLDLHYSKTIQHHHLVEAMQDARKRGLIAPTDLESPWLSETDRKLLHSLNDEGISYRTEA